MLTSSKRFVANLTVTLICATTLTLMAVTHTQGTTTAFAVVAVLVLFLCQLTLARSHSRQLLRADRYHRLGRKLLQLKRTKRRDESIAINVLNHIIQQSPDACARTRIWHQPLDTFSGDLALTARSEDGVSYTLIADLTGHGIAAAMGATPVASIFQAMARRGLPVEHIMVELNEKLRVLLPSGYFCCAAIITSGNGALRVCNAGLPAMRLVSREGELVGHVSSEELPLGIDELNSADVVLFSKTFQDDTRLYAFTDGLTESTNVAGEVFGDARLDHMLSTQCPANGRLDSIKSSFSSFVKGSTQSDDITVVEVKIC
jgi:serine phosphatase RsbU (regulator of sigma subunit)